MMCQIAVTLLLQVYSFSYFPFILLNDIGVMKYFHVYFVFEFFSLIICYGLILSF